MLQNPDIVLSEKINYLASSYMISRPQECEVTALQSTMIWMLGVLADCSDPTLLGYILHYQFQLISQECALQQFIFHQGWETLLRLYQRCSDLKLVILNTLWNVLPKNSKRSCKRDVD